MLTEDDFNHNYFINREAESTMIPTYCVECGQPIENDDGWLCERKIETDRRNIRNLN